MHIIIKSVKCLVVMNILVQVSNTWGLTEDGYAKIRIPRTYVTLADSEFGKTKRDCAFHCTHKGSECMGFTFQGNTCQVAKITPTHNFIPEYYIDDSDITSVMIKKKHITFGAKTDVTHVGYLGTTEVGNVYDMVMDEEVLIKTEIPSPTQGPHFAVLSYKRGVLACGGIDDKQCRYLNNNPIHVDGKFSMAYFMQVLVFQSKPVDCSKRGGHPQPFRCRRLHLHGSPLALCWPRR